MFNEYFLNVKWQITRFCAKLQSNSKKHSAKFGIDISNCYELYLSLGLYYCLEHFMNGGVYEP